MNKSAAEVLADLRLPASQVKIMIDEVLSKPDFLSMVSLARGDMAFLARLRELTQSLAVATSLASMIDDDKEFASLMAGATFTAGEPLLVKFGLQMVELMSECQAALSLEKSAAAGAERFNVIRAALRGECADQAADSLVD